MAIFRPILGDLLGSIGDTTWQRGPYGTIARRRTPPVNPSSTKQNTIRQAMAIASMAWQELTTAQRDSWDNYANVVSWTNKFGDTVKLGARQHFLRINNFTLYYSGAPDISNVVTDAPAVPGIPDAPGSVTLTADTTDGVEITSILGFDGSARALGCTISPPLQPGRMFWKGPWQKVFALQGTDFPGDYPYNVLTAGQVAAGQKYVLSFRLYNATSGLSNDILYVPCTVV